MNRINNLFKGIVSKWLLVVTMFLIILYVMVSFIDKEVANYIIWASLATFVSSWVTGILMEK